MTAVKNKSQRSVVAGSYRSCRSLAARARGLMFRRKLQDQALLFDFGREGIRELHMLFVFFPIDVLFLDRNKRVMEMKEKLLPFALYFPCKPARYVLELPNGAIKKSRTAVGDIIEW